VEEKKEGKGMVSVKRDFGCAMKGGGTNLVLLDRLESKDEKTESQEVRSRR